MEISLLPTVQLHGEALWVEHIKEYTLSILSEWVSRTSPITAELHVKSAAAELMQMYYKFSSRGPFKIILLRVLWIFSINLNMKMESFFKMEIFRISVFALCRVLLQYLHINDVLNCSLEMQSSTLAFWIWSSIHHIYVYEEEIREEDMQNHT